MSSQNAEGETHMTDKKVFQICSEVDEITFNPFERPKNWIHLVYWSLVLKPYINDEEPSESILHKYHFSPDGKTFEAEVSPKAKWQDGTPVSALEAAIGIAKGFMYRDISASVKVVGTEEINAPNFETKKYSGIKILSPNRFELTFESKVENVRGVIKEALLQGSMGNKVWPVRLNNGNQFDVVSRYPIKFENGRYILNVFDYKVELTTTDNCANNDFYFYDRMMEGANAKKEDFIVNKSPMPQTMVAIFNSQSKIFKNRDDRLKIASLLRYINSSQDKDKYISVPGHFVKGEPGFDEKYSWPDKFENFPDGIEKLTIALPNKFPKKTFDMEKLEEIAEKANVQIKWVTLYDKEEEYAGADIQYFFDRVQKGRQVWIQNMEKEPAVLDYLSHFPETLSALLEVTKTSTSIVPLNEKALKEFAKASFEEVSIVPVIRYNLFLYSKRHLPIQLKFTEDREFIFVKKQKQIYFLQ